MALFARKKRKSAVDMEQFLRAVPLIPPSVEIVRTRDGLIQAESPVPRPRSVIAPIKWFLPAVTYRRIELDEMGTKVFDLCDGERTIERIIEIFAAAHKFTFREAQVSVTSFLQMLTSRGLAVILAPKGADGS